MNAPVDSDTGPTRRLDYAAPLPPRSAINDPLDVLAISLAFALGHWVTEFATDYLLVLKWGIGVRSRPRKEFIGIMVVETFYAFSAAVAVVLVQLAAGYFFRPRTSSSPRRHSWVLALLLGAMFCWIRWGVWWMHRVVPFNYTGLADWLVAMALAASMGLIISRWRWSRPELVSG